MLNNKRLGPPAFAKGGSNHLSSFFSANYDEPDDGVDNSKQDFPASNVKPFITKSEASVMQCNVHPQTVYDLISFSEETNKETNSSLSTSHPPPKGAAVPQLKENPIKLASAASKPSLVQALAKPAPRYKYEICISSISL
ncbi:hypothetical protein EON63_03365 [archaeon]|nr:MAG: hypothetical protein EON63_03365 [archaeon]